VLSRTTLSRLVRDQGPALPPPRRTSHRRVSPPPVLRR
jgi:hypothetical protein